MAQCALTFPPVCPLASWIDSVESGKHLLSQTIHACLLVAVWMWSGGDPDAWSVPGCIAPGHWGGESLSTSEAHSLSTCGDLDACVWHPGCNVLGLTECISKPVCNVSYSMCLFLGIFSSCPTLGVLF